MFQDITTGPGTGTYASHTWEIVLMLLTAFLLGLLLGYVLWYKWRKMYLDLQAEHDRLRALHTDLEKDHASLRYKWETSEKDNADLRKKIMSLDGDVALGRAKIGKLEADLAACMEGGDPYSRGGVMAGAAAAPPPVPDDLKIVEGIGPKIAKLCNDAGIWTWRQLASTPVEHLRKMLDDAGPNYQIADPTTWPRQAELAAEGKWDELKEYKDFLVAGKNPD